MNIKIITKDDLEQIIASFYHHVSPVVSPLKPLYIAPDDDSSDFSESSSNDNILKRYTPLQMLKFFYNKNVIFVGFISKEYEKIIESYNGKIMKKLTKTIDIFVLKDINKNSDILDFRGQYSIVITKEELEKIIFIIKTLKKGV
jgi:hypothetical protein